MKIFNLNNMGAALPRITEKEQAMLKGLDIHLSSDKILPAFKIESLNFSNESYIDDSVSKLTSELLFAYQLYHVIQMDGFPQKINLGMRTIRDAKKLAIDITNSFLFDLDLQEQVQKEGIIPLAASVDFNREYKFNLQKIEKAKSSDREK